MENGKDQKKDGELDRYFKIKYIVRLILFSSIASLVVAVIGILIILLFNHTIFQLILLSSFRATHYR